MFSTTDQTKRQGPVPDDKADEEGDADDQVSCARFTEATLPLLHDFGYSDAERFEGSQAPADYDWDDQEWTDAEEEELLGSSIPTVLTRPAVVDAAPVERSLATPKLRPQGDHSGDDSDTADDGSPAGGAKSQLGLRRYKTCTHIRLDYLIDYDDEPVPDEPTDSEDKMFFYAASSPRPRAVRARTFVAHWR